MKNFHVKKRNGFNLMKESPGRENLSIEARPWPRNGPDIRFARDITYTLF